MAPEKWQAPFLREIANANELKYLDEFLLNKVRLKRSRRLEGAQMGPWGPLPLHLGSKAWIPTGMFYSAALFQINDLHSQKSAIECLFFEATEKFRGNLKSMYSAPVSSLL